MNDHARNNWECQLHHHRFSVALRLLIHDIYRGFAIENTLTFFLFLFVACDFSNSVVNVKWDEVKEMNLSEHNKYIDDIILDLRTLQQRIGASSLPSECVDKVRDCQLCCDFRLLTLCSFMY
jgi:hypothetical protein